MRAMGTSVKVVRKLANILSYFFVSGSVLFLGLCVVCRLSSCLSLPFFLYCLCFFFPITLHGFCIITTSGAIR